MFLLPIKLDRVRFETKGRQNLRKTADFLIESIVFSRKIFVQLQRYVFVQLQALKYLNPQALKYLNLQGLNPRNPTCSQVTDQTQHGGNRRRYHFNVSQNRSDPWT